MISKPKSRSRVVAALRVFLVNGAGPRVSADKSPAEPDHCDKHHKSVCVWGGGSPVNICWGKILCFGKTDQLKIFMRASSRGGDYDKAIC